MIEFFKLSWGSHIFITLLLGICILAQTLALILNFYRHSITAPRIFENLFEISILIEILVFSFMYGQMVNGYKSGLIAPTGYEETRILVFTWLLLLVIIISFLNKMLLPVVVLPAIIISLPAMEHMLGANYPLLFVLALIFILGRSIKICISSGIAIKTNISALSVMRAVDTLHTGILVSEKDGNNLLSNGQIQKLMLKITGKVFRNSIQFYEALDSGQYKTKYKKTELDGKRVYLLNDGTAWMFTKTDIKFRMKNYMHISVADVSELWSLTAKLQLQDEELRQKSKDLKESIANLHIFSKEKEIENAKMRAHDILGQRLTVLLRIIQDKDNLDYELLTSLSKGLLAELKAEQNQIRPQDEIKSIQQIFAAIGVDIRFEGQLPDNGEQANLFVDIIREGSTNAVRHGLATEINIKAKSTKQSYNLTISNNGYTTTTPIVPGSGIGVMINKVNAQGGNLDIIHHPLFTLSIDLPGGD